MSEELKACPFCGHTPVLLSNISKTEYVVHCDGCDAETANGIGGNTKAEAIAAWNRRTPDWQELAREMACIAAEQRLPYTCESCGHKTDKPCPKDALGLCEAQRWYPTEVIVAMGVKAGLLEEKP